MVARSPDSGFVVCSKCSALYPVHAVKSGKGAYFGDAYICEVCLDEQISDVSERIPDYQYEPDPMTRDDADFHDRNEPRFVPLARVKEPQHQVASPYGIRRAQSLFSRNKNDILQRAKNKWIITAVALAVVGLATLVVIGRNNRSRLMSPVERSVFEEAVTKVQAIEAAKTFVLRNLRAPKGAEFVEHDLWLAYQYGHNEWAVSGYVDSQNAFGVYLRSRFSVLLHYEEADSIWQMDSISIE